MHVRKGDLVVVLAGNDKGKRGTIQSVLLDKDRVIVEGVNLRWKHRKPSQKNPKGERSQLECSIHSSNVMLIDPSSDEPVRRRPAVQEKKKGASPKTKKKEASPAS